MRRSRQIALSILATVAISAGCAQEPSQLSLKREAYKSREDCLRDWNSEKDCEDIQDQQSHRWYGPRYFYWQGFPYIYQGPDRDPTPVSTAARFSGLRPGEKSAFSIGTEASIGRIARGGFGSTGASRSARS